MPSDPPPVPLDAGEMRSKRERRRATRLATRLRVDYFRLTKRDGAVTLGGAQRATATNISATGLQLSGATDLEVGHLLHLTLRLPDLPGNTVACEAKVVRRAEAPNRTVGCDIRHIQHWDSRRLAEFVARCNRA